MVVSRSDVWVLAGDEESLTVSMYNLVYRQFLIEKTCTCHAM